MLFLQSLFDDEPQQLFSFDFIKVFLIYEE